MKVYLVGGAVRDSLLGSQSYDSDYVVVGATEKELLDQGYKQVGQGFPVFLNPNDNCEYALARKEVKEGVGYTGFQFDFSPKITLEEDLFRRDLTINAIAKDLENGDLIDPFNGQDDLKKKLLRHVSPHFVEDPLRVIRLARFQALLPEFTILKETRVFVEQMIVNGELNHLTPQRVWKEIEKALKLERSDLFFSTLHEFGALNIILPLINFDKDKIETFKNLSKENLSIEIQYAFFLFLTHESDQFKKIDKEGMPKLVFKFLQAFTQLRPLVNELQSCELKDLEATSLLNLFKGIGELKDTSYSKQLIYVIEHLTNKLIGSQLNELKINLDALPLKEITEKALDKREAVNAAKLECADKFLQILV